MNKTFSINKQMHIGQIEMSIRHYRMLPTLQLCMFTNTGTWAEPF